MSRYRMMNITFIFFLLLNFSLQAKELYVQSDDELLIQAIVYDEYQAYSYSREIFATLYKKTNEEIYLFHEITSALRGNINIEKSIEKLKKWENKNKHNLMVKRLLIPLYLRNQEVKKAKLEAEALLEKSNKLKDLEIAVTPYFYTGEFDKALILLKRIYKQNKNEEIVLRMAIIMDEYTNERKKAIVFLEEHVNRSLVKNKTVYLKLLELYSKEKNINKVLELYTILYKYDKDEKYLIKILEIYAYKKDLDGAILFLETYHTGDTVLYELYKNQRYFKKALGLTKTLFSKTQDFKWLAEKAILIFELSKNKDDKKMLNDVIHLFDKALENGVQDSIYLNYYGYTLIEKKININKGITLLHQAVLQDPSNIYYLDSLAWGYYQNHNCKKSYDLMKKVIEKSTQKEAEILEHWDAIQKCK